MNENKELTSSEAAIERDKAADEAAKVRYFAPGDFVMFEEGGAFRLTIPDECTYLKFSAHRSYPLSMPDKYISLRDGMEEIGILKDLEQFDEETRTIVNEQLDKRYFVPKIKKITGTKERYGGMVWKVETDRGDKTLITKGLHEALSENSTGRYFITDVDGNRYEVIMEDITEETAAWIQSII